jgi:hypothetical protein
MNNDPLREKHDQLLTELYKEEALLKQISFDNTNQTAEKTADTAKKIKALQEELNQVRIEMYYY